MRFLSVSASLTVIMCLTSNSRSDPHSPVFSSRTSGWLLTSLLISRWGPRNIPGSGDEWLEMTGHILALGLKWPRKCVRRGALYRANSAQLFVNVYQHWVHRLNYPNFISPFPALFAAIIIHSCANLAVGAQISFEQPVRYVCLLPNYGDTRRSAMSVTVKEVEKYVRSYIWKLRTSLRLPLAYRAQTAPISSKTR